MGVAFTETGVPDFDAHPGPALAPAGPETGDRLLVLAFQAGDRAAFDELYRRYRERAEMVCRRYLPSAEDAEEAAQETMMRVLRGLPALAGDYAVRAWVDKIAANVALDAIRARARRPPMAPATAADPSEAEDGPRSDDPGDMVEAMARSLEIRETLAAMPEAHRAALVLREVEGRSHVEIGDALGISSDQAKALVHRARRKFQRAWREGCLNRVRALVPLAVPVRLRGLLAEGSPAPFLPRASAALPLSAAGGAGEHLAAAVAALVLAGGVAGSLAGPVDRPPPPAPNSARAAVADPAWARLPPDVGLPLVAEPVTAPVDAAAAARAPAGPAGPGRVLLPPLLWAPGVPAPGPPALAAPALAGPPALESPAGTTLSPRLPAGMPATGAVGDVVDGALLEAPPVEAPPVPIPTAAVAPGPLLSAPEAVAPVGATVAVAWLGVAGPTPEPLRAVPLVPVAEAGDGIVPGGVLG